MSMNVIHVSFYVLIAASKFDAKPADVPVPMNPRIRKFYSAIMALCRTVLCSAVAFSPAIQATSVIEVSLDEMLQHSSLVFEGQVVDIQVRENANHAIQTLVTFEIFDVIRGDVQGRKMTLEFLGGELAGRKLSVSAMQMPVLNERGIYFVESPAHTQVNPLYGWSQGHLVLEEGADGTDRVFTRSGRPVRGVGHSNGKRPRGLSNGVARGLVTGDPGDVATALDSREFKRLLRAMR